MRIETQSIQPGSMLKPETSTGSRWLVLGPSGSGKTYAVMAAIKRGWFGEHDEEFLMSPSFRQEAYAHSWTAVFPAFSSEELAAIAFRAQVREEHGIKRRTLVVVDDALGSEGLTRRTANALGQLYSRGRHLQIDVLTLSQRAAGLPGELRSSCSVIAFSTRNMADIDLLYQIAGSGSRRDFADLLAGCWRQKFRPFIYVQPSDSTFCGYDRRLLISLDRDAAAAATASSATSVTVDSEPAEHAEHARESVETIPRTTAETNLTSEKTSEHEATAKTQEDHSEAHSGSDRDNVAVTKPGEEEWWGGVE